MKRKENKFISTYNNDGFERYGNVSSLGRENKRHHKSMLGTPYKISLVKVSLEWQYDAFLFMLSCFDHFVQKAQNIGCRPILPPFSVYEQAFQACMQQHTNTHKLQHQKKAPK